LAEDGTRNSVYSVLIIRCLPASVLAEAQLHFSSYFRKAVRSLLFRRFSPVARPSWPSQAFYFSASRHRGNGWSVWHSRSLDYFCFDASSLKTTGSNIHFMVSGREVELSAGAVCKRSFINGSRGHSVFDRNAGAVENDDFIFACASRFSAGDDIA
jgi:hypothetical protein